MNKPAQIAGFEAKRLIADLVEAGNVSQGELDHAISLAQQSGQTLRTVLDRTGVMSQRDYAETVARVAQLKFVTLDDMPFEIPTDDRLSQDYLKRNNIVALELSKSCAAFAVADPSATASINALRLTYGPLLDLCIATDRDIEAAYARAEEPQPEQKALAAKVGDPDTDYLVELANDAPTIKYVERLLAIAIESGATDIHLEPFEAAPRARLRIDGFLTETHAPDRTLYGGVVSRVKILAGLDIAERRLPQDGRIRHQSHGRKIDIRVATAPTVHGEAITLRLLNTTERPASLDDLGMPTRPREILSRVLNEPNGLLLVTGPTGSGKTTTLHAALSELNDIGRKIVTIENPVEIHTPGVIQLEVNPGLGWTFASALRTILRHDPDVLMVGEIRDAETAELAVRAAMTGHLVLSTLHTNSAGEAVTRLMDMGVPEYLLRSVTRAVFGQRLVRQTCQNCGHTLRLPSDEKRSRVNSKLSAMDPRLGPVESWNLQVARGCPSCNNTGYSGRKAIFEALTGAEVFAGHDAAARAGYRPLGIEGLGMVASGETTIQELIRVVGAPGSWKIGACEPAKRS